MYVEGLGCARTFAISSHILNDQETYSLQNGIVSLHPTKHKSTAPQKSSEKLPDQPLFQGQSHSLTSKRHHEFTLPFLSTD